MRPTLAYFLIVTASAFVEIVSDSTRKQTKGLPPVPNLANPLETCCASATSTTPLNALESNALLLDSILPTPHQKTVATITSEHGYDKGLQQTQISPCFVTLIFPNMATQYGYRRFFNETHCLHNDSAIFIVYY